MGHEVFYIVWDQRLRLILAGILFAQVNPSAVFTSETRSKETLGRAALTISKAQSQTPSHNFHRSFRLHPPQSLHKDCRPCRRGFALWAWSRHSLLENCREASRSIVFRRTKLRRRPRARRLRH